MRPTPPSVTAAGQQDDSRPLLLGSHVYGNLSEMLGQDGQEIESGTVLTFERDESQSRFCVIAGWLAVSKSLEDGQQQILDFVLPGESFDPVSSDGETSYVQLEALCDVTVLRIDRSGWAQLLDDLPDLRRSEQLRDKAAQSRQAERLLRLGKASAESRIAYVLIELCMRLTALGGTKDGAFHVPLSQQQLGDFAGLSSVHVCRTLRRLNRKGMITTGDHMDIAIHDVDALAELASVDLGALRAHIIPSAA